ncbi:hypothetical protein TWF506_009240 [Arthrobotrys conoides]|uniref:AAA+ ATPase domain-containing protein n=1 Tax=Arthrobotrys conoides TaxID=74498 RepID=A0AAN8NM90_9PEZI
MATAYVLPPRFLAGNVKSLAKLEAEEPTFEVIGYPPIDAPQERDLPVQCNPVSQQLSDTRSSLQSNSEKYSMPYRDYLETRDQVVCGLINNSGSEFSSERMNTLLHTESLGTAYVQALVEYLARDIRANLMCLDIQDFEELGYHFQQQDVEAKSNVDDANQEENALQEEEDGAKQKPSSESRNGWSALESFFDRMIRGIRSEIGNSGYDKAKTYFGAAKPTGRYHNVEEHSRTKAALTALLDSPLNDGGVEHGAEESSQISEKKPEPLIMFIHDVKKIRGVRNGNRILSRIRDAITERRMSGIPIIGLFSWVGCDFENSIDSCLKKTGSAEFIRLPEGSDGNEVSKKKKRELQNRQTNIRLLKQGLKRSFAEFVDDEVIGNEADWGSKKVRHVDSLLCREELPTTDVNRLVRLIGARAHGKSKIKPQDVMDILDGKESRRIRESIIRGEASDPRIKDLTGLERDLSQYTVTPGKTSLTHDDVVMDPETKATILQLLQMSSQQNTTSISGPLSNEFKMTGILFYGPPGTGKTQLCRAVANDAGQTFIALTAATLSNSRVGETEKLIQAAFSLARKLHPSILFFDEVDSLFYRRASGDKSWERSALTQYLHEMDGLTSQTANAPVVIVATNRPADLDSAFLRRLPHKVYFKLPSRPQRREILCGLLNQDEMEDIDLNAIAKSTIGFSGSDLKNLCSQAILSWRTEKRMEGTTHLSSGKVDLTMRHFETALSRAAPTTTPEVLEGLLEFRDRFQH